MKGPAGILGLIAVLAAGYGARTLFSNFVGSLGTDKTSKCMEMISNTTTEEENGATYIIGSIKNNCDVRVGQVTIAFKLDRTAENLAEGQAFAYSSDVKAGEIREFKTVLPISKDSSYRFDGINAF